MERYISRPKENNFQPRLLYPTEKTFIIERVVKILHDKQKQKYFLATKPALQKRTLYIEEEEKHNQLNRGRLQDYISIDKLTSK
jgi:hypothetical protein